MFPWHDRSGRVSALKSVIFAGLFGPGLWIAWALAAGALGGRPITEAIHETGLWTIRLLFVSLTITPLRRILAWPQLVQTRRMIGVAAFCYGVAHLALYAADENFHLGFVASEIVLRIYLTIGFATLLGLAVLAVTSTDGMIRRLGGRRWRRLHQAVYLLAALATTHYFMQSKADVTEATVMAGLYGWLMASRLPGVAERLPLAGLPLAVLAGLATAGFEAGYYGVVTGIPAALVLQANLTLMAGLRPAWTVALIAAAVSLAGIGRHWFKSRGASEPRRRRPAMPRSAMATD